MRCVIIQVNSTITFVKAEDGWHIPISRMIEIYKRATGNFPRPALLEKLKPVTYSAVFDKETGRTALYSNLNGEMLSGVYFSSYEDEAWVQTGKKYKHLRLLRGGR